MPRDVARPRFGDSPQLTGSVERDAFDATRRRVALLDKTAGDVELLERAPTDLAARDPQLSGRCDGGSLRVARDRHRSRRQLFAQHRPVGQRLEDSPIKSEYSAPPVFLVGADPYFVRS